VAEDGDQPEEIIDDGAPEQVGGDL